MKEREGKDGKRGKERKIEGMRCKENERQGKRGKDWDKKGRLKDRGRKERECKKEEEKVSDYRGSE